MKPVCPNRPLIIAEVKPMSPFTGFRSAHTWMELFDMACRVGDIISVHIDPRWEGSIELVHLARKLTDKPILAKGPNESDDNIAKAFATGADYVLIVLGMGRNRIPASFPIDKLLIEPCTIEQLETFPSEALAVWNSRNLVLGGVLKAHSFSDARAVWKGWLCQASNIKSISDIDPRAQAVIIGEKLPDIVDELEVDKLEEWQEASPRR